MPRIQTYSNKLFDVANPTLDQVCFEDIMHALAHIPRFTGHTRVPYTVMQHSLEVSRMVGEWTPDPMEALRGLLHDAHETYTNDMSGPKKEVLPEYCVFENRIAALVAEYFGIPAGKSELVHRADVVACSTEYHQLFSAHPWQPPLPPADYVCAYENPLRVRARFVRRFLELADRLPDQALRDRLYVMVPHGAHVLW